MEEMMMKIRSHETSSDAHHPNINYPNVTSVTCPTWKLYENPFYIMQNQKQLEQDQHLQSHQQDQDSSDHHKQIRRLHLPISTSSFWDLTFIKSLMESELETARAQINELKAELETEHRAGKKMESLNKRQARELAGEREAREALEKVCQELAKEISSYKAEINRIRHEIEEERKMLRVSEVIREERVQMKLAEAKMLMEEKFSELENGKKIESESSLSSNVHKNEVRIDYLQGKTQQNFSFGERLRFVLGEKTQAANNIGNVQSMAVMQRRASLEAENPHIKRGIKGFVEFPKVVRAIGCRSSKHLSSKLECQKAQLKILLKQKGPVRFNGLIAS